MSPACEISHTFFESIRHPDEDPLLEKIFSGLADALLIPSGQLSDLGIQADEPPVNISTASEVTAQASAHVAACLGLTAFPPVYQTFTLACDAALADTRPTNLLIGGPCLDSTSPAEVAFLLARA